MTEAITSTASSSSSSLIQATASRVEVIKGDQGRITSILLEAALRAASDPVSPYFNIVADRHAPALSTGTVDLVRQLKDKYPKYVVRYIYDVQPDNVEHVKKIIESKMIEVRHLEGIKANFGITKKDYYASIGSLEQGFPLEIVWSQDFLLLDQMNDLFWRLWESAIPADSIVRELESGIDRGYSRFTYDTNLILKTFGEFVDSTENEALAIVPTEDGLRRNAGTFRKLAKKVREGNVLVKVLIPAEEGAKPDLSKLAEELGLDAINFRTVRGIVPNFAYGIYDRKAMIVTHYVSAQSSRKLTTPEDVALFATISTNKETVEGQASFFDLLWRETELREEQEKSARQANLLQDILSHDIRNYNQVARLSADLLMQEFKDNVTARSILDSLLKAIDGSSELLTRIKKIGKILADKNPDLFQVDLRKAISDSLALIKASHHEKAIQITEAYPMGLGPYVMADDIG